MWKSLFVRALRTALAAGLLFTSAIQARPVQFASVLGFGCDPSNPGLIHPIGKLSLNDQGILVGGSTGAAFQFHTTGLESSLTENALPGSLYTRGADGNYYGIVAGTIFDSGRIFRMTPDGVVTDLHVFSRVDANGLNADGSDPQAIVAASDGNLYGITGVGGPLAHGTVFKLTLGGSLSVLHARTLADGRYGGTLIQGGDGNFYGATYAGGSTGEGTLYKFTPDGTHTLLHTFSAANSSGVNSDGIGPNAVALGADGTLYGTTMDGGPNGKGVIFKLAPDGQFSLLHAFDPISSAGKNVGGATPRALVFGPDGQLYGTASGGGAGAQGVLFKVDTDGNYAVFHQFIDTGAYNYDSDAVNFGGGAPYGIVFTPDGTLYGTTKRGGCAGVGTLFRVKFGVGQDEDVDASGTSDLVQFDSATRQLAVGLATGSSVDSWAPTPVAAGYYPVAVADFDGDGAADILWTSPRRDLYLWLATPASEQFTARYAGTYPSGWVVSGAGDLNGDGKADILWTNKGGRAFGYWLMDGAHRTGSFTTSVSAGYYPVAFGDFNGDGLTDVAWSSARNDLYLWFGNAGQATGFIARRVAVFPADWMIAGTGDVDGDGKDDLIWTQVAGSHWGYWLMDGPGVKSTAIKPKPASSRLAFVGDTDGDGLADLVWNDGSNLNLSSNAVTYDNGTLQNTFSMTVMSGTGAKVPIFNNQLPAH